MLQEFQTDCGQTFYTSKPWPLTFCTFRTFAELREAYGTGEGRHYFDGSTLAFFGSSLSGFALIAGTGGAATIERQAKAPAGMRYRAELWALDSDGRPDPVAGCSHTTEREAKACAVATFRSLSAVSVTA